MHRLSRKKYSRWSRRVAPASAITDNNLPCRAHDFSSPTGWAGIDPHPRRQETLDDTTLGVAASIRRLVQRHSSIKLPTSGPGSAFGEALAGWVNASEGFASTSAAMNANAIFFNIAVILLCYLDRGYSLSLGK